MGTARTLRDFDMKLFARSFSTAMLAAVPMLCCAEEHTTALTPATKQSSPSADTDTRVELLATGDVFTVRAVNKREVIASFFTTEPAGGEALLERIIWILKKIDADPEFVDAVRQRLPNNPRLKQNDFSLTLTDMDGDQHLLKYVSDANNRFYILNYSN